MIRPRVLLNELLVTTLPGFVRLNESHGRWQSAGGPAGWKLEPAEGGFWLVLEGADVEAVPRDPLAAARCWPWPLKAVRRGPGAPWAWSAELRLSGFSEDRSRLLQLRDQLDRWLAGGHRSEDHRLGRGEKARSNELDGEEKSRSKEEGADLLAEVLGDALRPSQGGYRLTVAEGPTLVFRPDREGGGWQVNCTLARANTPLPPPSWVSLRDYLGVANGRIRGCRALVDTGPEILVRLERLIPRAEVSTGAILETVALLTDAGRLLGLACQVLCDVPDTGVAYEAYLLGGQSSEPAQPS
jgi:hypothetical protein